MARFDPSHEYTNKQRIQAQINDAPQEGQIMGPSEEFLPQAERALDVYCQTGSMVAAAREVGLTVYELKKLTQTPWWTEQVLERKRIEKQEWDGKFTTLMEKGYELLLDQLVNGEDRLTASGKIVKMPMSSREVIKLLGDVFDRRQVLRGELTPQTADTGKLAELAGKLEALGKAAAAQLPQPSRPEVGGSQTDGRVMDAPPSE